MVENLPQLKIEQKDGYLILTFPPYRSLQQIENVINEMYAAVDKYNCHKLLIDLRSTKKKIPIIELYELCIYLVSKVGHLNARIAVIASPEAVYPDRFGENVVRNRGLDLIRFVEGEQGALEWLLAAKAAVRT